MARCELGHQSESTFEKLRSDDGKRRSDFGPGYSLCAKQQLSSDRGSYQVSEKSCKKTSSNPVGGKGGDIPGEKGEESEGDQLRSGAAENLESMPLRCYLWTLWCHKDTQTDRREVLLEGNGCRCEKVGKQCVVCVVYITFWQDVKDNLIVHAQQSTVNGYQRY